MFGLIRLTVRRARQERLAQVAGSLTFTTVLSIVPLLAVSFALFTRFPAFRRFETALEQQLLRSLLPPELSRTVLKHLHQFAANADRLTLMGTAFLLLTTLAMLLTVENALNQMWNVKRPRPLLRRLGVYLLLLAAGPPVLGLALWAVSAAAGAGLGLMREPPAAARALMDAGPALLTLLGLTALYLLLPSARVTKAQALAGGAMATLVLELGKRAFGGWLMKLPTYKAVYGAFAAVPVFLLWVYFSWLVTLGAALVIANLAQRHTAGAPARTRRATP